MNTSSQRLSAADIQRVTIEIERGKLTVAWHGDDIAIDGDGLAVEREAAATVQVDASGTTTTRHGDELLIRGRGDHRTRAAITLPTRLPVCAIALRQGDITLDQPAGRVEVHVERGDLRVHGGQADLTLRQGSGDATVEGLRGPLTLHTGSGDVNLTEIAGAVDVKSGSGDIRLRGGAGETAIRTGSGDATVTGRDCPRLSVMTGSGDVNLIEGGAGQVAVQSGSGDIRSTLALGLGAHGFTTSSGDISLGIPPGLAARIEAITGQGSLRSSLPLVTVGQRGPRSPFGRRLVGSIGEGEPRAEINLRTGRGDVRLDWLGGAREPGGGLRLEETGPGEHGRGLGDQIRSTIREVVLTTLGREREEGALASAITSTVISAQASAVDDARWTAPPTPPGSPVPPRPPAPPASPVSPASPDAPTAPTPPTPPAPPAPAASVMPAPPPEVPLASSVESEQRAVLAALAAGSITVAEAERLLAGLEAR